MAASRIIGLSTKKSPCFCIHDDRRAKRLAEKFNDEYGAESPITSKPLLDTVNYDEVVSTEEPETESSDNDLPDSHKEAPSNQ